MSEGVSTGYEPRELQLQLHRELQRFNVLVAHRRFGKTVFTVNEMIDQGLRCLLERPRYAYIAPYLKQAKAIAWDYFQHYLRPLPGVKFNQAELRADIAGRRFQLFGADNPDALRGIYLDGVVFDEYALMDPRVWGEIVRPLLTDRSGWAIFIGTPMGRNSFYELYQKAPKRSHWHRAMFKASDTDVLTEEELEQARSEMSAEQYEQEFECSFDAAIRGAIYKEEIGRAREEGRIGAVPYDRYLPVYTSWDLGFTDATAIWFIQLAGGEIHFIDYYEASGEPLTHYADVIREKGYEYAEHYFPHDVRAHELISGLSRFETLRALGIEPNVVPNHRVDDGINAMRRIFDRCWFDEKNCDRGIEALTMYCREYDDKLQILKPRPKHDWTSHGSDAARIFAAGFPNTPMRKKRDAYRVGEPRSEPKSWMSM